jgi:hypothetical protein
MIRHRPWAAPPYDFSIGLKPIREAVWLEGGATEAERKAELLTAAPRNVWGELEGSRAGQAEACALGSAATGQTAQRRAPPLWAASLLCADDLCLMEKVRGAWTLTAASLCSPTFFTVADALGKDLAGLHDPVPGYGARFLSRVTRIFDALSDEAILERRNWTVACSGEAYLPSAAPVVAALADIAPKDAASRLFLRVERQTIRKLPETGAVLFTIRAWRNPLGDLAADRRALEAFAAAWRGADETFRAYKGLAHYDALVEAFLEKEGGA